MERNRALALLELTEGSSGDEVRRRYRQLHSKFQVRLSNPPTPILRRKYQHFLTELQEACDVLCGDGERIMTRAWDGDPQGDTVSVLLLLSVADRRSRLEIGQGLTVVIGNSAAATILRNMRTAFRQDKFGEALFSAAREIGERAARSKNARIDFTPHPITLVWMEQGAGLDVTWEEARDYCTSLNATRHAGYSKWRLPIIDELHFTTEPARSAPLLRSVGVEAGL